MWPRPQSLRTHNQLFAFVCDSLGEMSWWLYFSFATVLDSLISMGLQYLCYNCRTHMGEYITIEENYTEN